jgi:aminopeptidase YwaD
LLFPRRRNNFVLIRRIVSEIAKIAGAVSIAAAASVYTTDPVACRVGQLPGYGTQHNKLICMYTLMMNTASLLQNARDYLHRLCVVIPERPTGSAGNRQAAEFFEATITAFGFETARQVFDCLDWQAGSASLVVAGQTINILTSPYSPGVDAQAPLVVAESLDELLRLEAGDNILLLRGALAREPLMPKNFTFYNPEEHQQIIRSLESINPRAIIAATGRSPELAGALYPFPLIEDGDFDIPSVYLTDEAGARLATLAGKTATLHIQAERRPARGWNVVARKPGKGERRLVCFAHLDAKPGTPGALDNAAGVTTLLLLAELLADYAGEPGIEITALNGEDYYANPGEQLYLQLNAGKFGEIALGVNLDGLGYRKGKLAYSLYGCPPGLSETIRTTFAGFPGLVEGDPWVQGDHFLFIMNDVPALAITSELVNELLSEVCHTPHDSPELVDPQWLVTAALALRELVSNP